jgi:5-methylphenazine-1-carboxylate 1-monooxygenase
MMVTNARMAPHGEERARAAQAACWSVALARTPVGFVERAMRIAIVGGGIGGMTLALAPKDAGLDDVQIYESASAIRELGVGISVMPHGARELAELGLLDDLLAEGVPTAEMTYFTKRGQTIWTEPRGLAAGYRWPQVSIHRGRLLGILHRAVVARLGADRVHTGHHTVRVGQDAGGAWVEFADRASGAASQRVEADLVVGCDGVHSVVRQTFYPDEGPPLWNGRTMWRGVSVCQPFLGGRVQAMIGHAAIRVVVYAISKPHEDRGEALYNWNAMVQTDTGRPTPPQDWMHTARPEDALAHFDAFRFDFLDLPEMIQRADAIYQYPMVDRDPLPSWDFGRITLLGDAAHPMYPIGGNGASQAIIDARVLARELALQPSIEAAVTVYDEMRRPATATVVLANRQEGPLACQNIVEERAPNGFTNLADVVSQEELEEIANRYKRGAGFDHAVLNNRPSFSVRPDAARSHTSAVGE